MVKLKIKKGDKVVVIAGKDKGKTGEVLRVLPQDMRVLVQGVNMVKRHTRPAMGQPGGIVEKEAMLHISNVAHIDPKSDKPTRIGFKTLDGRKVRFARKSGEVLDWTIVSENSGNADALEYKAVGHIPRGMTFVAGSAKAEGNAKAIFSIDGGKSFSAQPTIEEKQADGTVKRVPAPVSMYTEVRYEWSDPLTKGGKLSASYKVRVK